MKKSGVAIHRLGLWVESFQHKILQTFMQRFLMQLKLNSPYVWNGSCSTKKKGKDCFWPSTFWESKETISGFSCPLAAFSLSVEQTWREGQHFSCPHTPSPHEVRGVNPVSNKLGLTLVNLTTSVARTTTKMIYKDFSHTHTRMHISAQAFNLTLTHTQT